MPTFPLYKAVERLEDTWDQVADRHVLDRWSFAPIPATSTSQTGRWFLHVEGGAEPHCWFRAEVGAVIRDGADGGRLVTRTAPGGLFAWQVAGAIATGRHGLTPAPTPERAPDDDVATRPGPEPTPAPDDHGESDRTDAGPDLGGTPHAGDVATAGGSVTPTPGVDPGPSFDGDLSYADGVRRCLVRDYRDTRPPTADELRTVTRAGLNAGQAANAIAVARTLTTRDDDPKAVIETTVEVAAELATPPKPRPRKPSNPRQSSLF